MKKVFLKISKKKKIHRKNLCQSFYLNKVARLKACNFIKKETLAQLFPVNFAIFFFLENLFHITPLVAASVRWIFDVYPKLLSNSKNHKLEILQKSLFDESGKMVFNLLFANHSI